MIKKINKLCLILLLLWFSVFVTGLSFGDTVFAERDFDTITIIWWVLFIVAVIIYFVKTTIGQYVCVIFEFVWIVMQGLNFFSTPEGVAKYNKFFENTHHIIKPTETFLVPDTAHMILFSLLILSFIMNIMAIISYRKSCCK